MKATPSRTVVAALLQAAALVILLLALLGVHWFEDTRPGVLVLVLPLLGMVVSMNVRTKAEVVRMIREDRNAK